MKTTSFFATALLLIMLSVMVFAQGEPDSCPPTGQVGICAILCGSDEDCSGNEKCCRTACGGWVCTKPISKAPNVVKEGSCPAQPTGRWTCSSVCRTDGDCRGNKKCCRNRCGAMACQNPVFVNVEDYDYRVVPAAVARNYDS